MNTIDTLRRRVLKVGVSTAIAGVLSLLVAGPALSADGEVNIYSMRQEYLITPILEAFTAETGIKVNVLFAKKGLIERLEQEGENSPADVVLTSSFGNMMKLVDKDLAQPVMSDTLNQRIPAQYRAEDGTWYSLTNRARILYVAKGRVPEGAITTYEGLADPKWRGKICTRSGIHPYNVQLFASMVAHHGLDDAKAWLEGLKANLARQPTGNDRAQVKAVSEGECDIAVGNSYYFFKMLDNDEQRAWAESVNPVFPNASDPGTHVNASGVILAKHAPNPESGILLMEFLASEMAQRIYADGNYEYPVNPAVQPSGALKAIGTLNPDPLPMTEMAAHLSAALKLVAEVGYND